MTQEEKAATTTSNNNNSSSGYTNSASEKAWKEAMAEVKKVYEVGEKHEDNNNYYDLIDSYVGTF